MTEQANPWSRVKTAEDGRGRWRDIVLFLKAKADKLAQANLLRN